MIDAADTPPESLPAAAAMSRRRLLATTGMGLGGIALAELLARRAVAAVPAVPHGALDAFHLPPKAKRVICFNRGGRHSSISTTGSRRSSSGPASSSRRASAVGSG